MPADLPAIQKAAVCTWHWLLYALMLAMPLVGWAMVSAGGYPVTVFRRFDLPAIAPHDPTLYAVLRAAHGYLALLLFATVLAHLAAALYHAWVRRDGVFRSMTGAAIPTPQVATPMAEPLP
jgi:cytochrome b561